MATAEGCRTGIPPAAEIADVSMHNSVHGNDDEGHPHGHRHEENAGPSQVAEMAIEIGGSEVYAEVQKSRPGRNSVPWSFALATDAYGPVFVRSVD